MTEDERITDMWKRSVANGGTTESRDAWVRANITNYTVILEYPEGGSDGRPEFYTDYVRAMTPQQAAEILRAEKAAEHGYEPRDFAVAGVFMGRCSNFMEDAWNVYDEG